MRLDFFPNHMTECDFCGNLSHVCAGGRPAGHPAHGSGPSPEPLSPCRCCEAAPRGSSWPGGSAQQQRHGPTPGESGSVRARAAQGSTCLRGAGQGARAEIPSDLGTHPQTGKQQQPTKAFQLMQSDWKCLEENLEMQGLPLGQRV